MDQGQYDALLSFLRTGKFPEGLTKNERDSLRRKSKSFVVNDERNKEGYGDQEGENSSAEMNQEEDGGQEAESCLEVHIKRMVGIRRKALENIKVAQERQKTQYDAKHSQDKAKYKVGALVLVKNS